MTNNWHSPSSPQFSILRSLTFLGKPKDNKFGIDGEYKIYYRNDNQKVSVDYQDGGKGGKDGEEVYLKVPTKRVGKWRIARIKDSASIFLTR